MPSSSGDVDREHRRRSLYQDPREVSEDTTDWRQVCFTSRTEGNLRHPVQDGGEVVEVALILRLASSIFSILLISLQEK